MLSENLIELLNDQINLEFYSANFYLQMSSWCEFKGFEGCASFLKHHADEEMTHMHRLFNYVNETGALAQIGAIDAPPCAFKEIGEVFEAAYEHEKYVTGRINSLAHSAFTGQDYSTFNFLQWYVAEQHEEEKIFKTILDKIELISGDGKALFFLDREVASLVKDAGSVPSQAG